MMLTYTDWLSVMPELALLGTALLVLGLGLSTHKRHHDDLLLWVTVVGFALSAVLAWHCDPITGAPESTFFGLYLYGAQAFHGKAVLASLMAFVTKMMRPYIKRHELKSMELMLLMLLATVGMMMMAACDNLITAYMGVELLSLPLYAVVVIKPQQFSSVEAGMKYFVMGAVASAIMLYGMSFLYGACGSLNFPVLFDTASAMPQGYLPLYATGWVLMLVGALFKLGVAPFHMWVPDVYEGAPQIATLLVATVPKLAMFGLMARLFEEPALAVINTWPVIIALVGVASMFVGNLLALAQKQIWRLLAYSSIAHMGVFILCWWQLDHMALLTAAFYMVTYVVAAIIMMGLLCNLHFKDGRDLTEIESLKGLYRRHPKLAVVATIAVFSMAGVPPLVGFMAKMVVIDHLVGGQGVMLAIAVMVAAVVGIFYYIRLVRVMFFSAVHGDADDGCMLVYDGNTGTTSVLILLTVIVVVLGIHPAFMLA